MWSYYELTTAQTQADRFNEAGYMLPAAAKREFPQDAVRRALVQGVRNTRTQTALKNPATDIGMN